jgi:hypothetical protein
MRNYQVSVQMIQSGSCSGQVIDPAHLTSSCGVGIYIYAFEVFA